MDIYITAPGRLSALDREFRQRDFPGRDPAWNKKCKTVLLASICFCVHLCIPDGCTCSGRRLCKREQKVFAAPWHHDGTDASEQGIGGSGHYRIAVYLC